MRDILIALAIATGLVALATATSAQQPSRVPVVGVLRISSPASNDPSMETLRAALGERGYVEGRNIKLEQRFAHGQADRLPRLAQELVRLNTDVIIATNEASVRAAKQATSTIPIIMVAYDHDPVASGMVQSLSHPGGNITGIFSRQLELVGKRLELLKETLPDLSRVAVFHASANRRAIEELEAAARSIGVGLQVVNLQSREDFAAVFKTAKKKGSSAGIVLFSPALYAERLRLAEAAIEARLPTMSQERDFVQAGFLMSYAPDRDAILSRVAYYVDRILKGAKPSELPVEQADKFRLTVNLRTAKALGITIPQSILPRADEVIR